MHHSWRIIALSLVFVCLFAPIANAVDETSPDYAPLPDPLPAYVSPGLAPAQPPPYEDVPMLNADPARYRMVIDMKNQVVRIYQQDSRGVYSDLVRLMVCSTGTSKKPSPVGTFSLAGGKVRFGYFPKFKCYAQYWTQITRNIYMHSVLYTARDERKMTKSSYNNLGKRASHGCIRLLPEDAKWVYQNICKGTTVRMSYNFPDNPKLRALVKPPKLA